MTTPDIPNTAGATAATSERYTVTIACALGFPPSPNDRRRLSWARQRRLIAGWRELAAWEARRQLYQLVQRGGLARARVTYIFTYPPRVRAHDPDGRAAIAKPLLDGLVDAGVLPGDTSKYVEMGQHSQRRGEVGAIEIDLESLVPTQGAD